MGREFVDHNIEIWGNMLPVLELGEHCPTRLEAGLAPVSGKACERFSAWYQRDNKIGITCCHGQD
jgi:hypothetical protein